MAKGSAAAKKQKETEAKPEKIGTVLLSKVNRKVLVKFAKQLKYGDDKDTTEVLVANLVARFSKLPANRLAECNDCGGESDKELEACPYCGAADEDDDGESESASGDDESASADSPRATVDDASASIDDDPKIVSAQRQAVGDNTKLSIAAASPNTIAQYTETDLNEAVVRVTRMKGDSMVSHWRLGAEIKAIYEKQLWKQRNKDGGAPAYSSFNQFVIAELGFTTQNAYWLMSVSASFTEEQVRAYGTSKLGAILTAPKEERPRLLEAAKAGASVRELKTEIREINTNTTTEQSTRRKPREKGARAKPAPKKKKVAKGTITVARILGKQSVDLFKGPWPRTGKPETHAKKLGDNPVGVLDFENGVVMHFSISQTGTGRLVLRIDTRRED